MVLRGIESLLTFSRSSCEFPWSSPWHYRWCTWPTCNAMQLLSLGAACISADMHISRLRRTHGTKPCRTSLPRCVLSSTQSASGPHRLSSFYCSLQGTLPALSRRLSLLLSFRFGQILNVKDDPNHQTATRADGDLFTVSQVVDRDLKAVAAGAWVCVSLKSGIVGHVLGEKDCQWAIFLGPGFLRRDAPRSRSRRKCFRRTFWRYVCCLYSLYT